MDEKAWEEAFVAYGLDAAVGRRFRGLTHNLNGVAQAFSMQTELLGMFFSRAGEILQQLEQAPTLEETREMGQKLSRTPAPPGRSGWSTWKRRSGSCRRLCGAPVP